MRSALVRVGSEAHPADHGRRTRGRAHHQQPQRPDDARPCTAAATARAAASAHRAPRSPQPIQRGAAQCRRAATATARAVRPAPTHSHGMVLTQCPKNARRSRAPACSGARSRRRTRSSRPDPIRPATATRASPEPAIVGRTAAPGPAPQTSLQPSGEHRDQDDADHGGHVEGQDLRHLVSEPVDDLVRVAGCRRVVDGVDHAGGDDGRDPRQSGPDAGDGPAAARAAVEVGRGTCGPRRGRRRRGSPAVGAGAGHVVLLVRCGSDVVDAPASCTGPTSGPRAPLCQESRCGGTRPRHEGPRPDLAGTSLGRR